MDETPITCYNNTKIFIQSALYGRSNNFTCLSGQEVSSCNTLVDVSWRVLPDCQGKSSCVVSGSFDGLGSPCISSYFNISYDCKTRKLQGCFFALIPVLKWKVSRHSPAIIKMKSRARSVARMSVIHELGALSFDHVNGRGQHLAFRPPLVS